MEENKLYTQAEVDLITGSIYAEAYNAGLNDNGHKIPGAVWVKASEFKYEVGMAYHAKDSKSKGAGSFDDFGNFFWGDGSFTAGENQEDLLILDESAAGREDDWIDVNERLPYKDGDSSVYCLVNDTYDGIVVRPFNEAHVCWDQEDGDDYYTDAKGGKITHWKPLPVPPKRKQQKQNP